MCQFASQFNRLVSYPVEWVSGPCTKLYMCHFKRCSGRELHTYSSTMNHCMTSTMEFTEDQAYMAMGVVALDRLNFRRNG